MKNEELVKKVSQVFIRMKKTNFANLADMDYLTHNQKLVLFILHEHCKNGKILLTDIRQQLKLAPSTITPIITSLENEGFIKRNIDKNDRRSIYLQITNRGKEYTNMVHSKIYKELEKYVDYMGKEDINELIRIMNKTALFFEMKGRGIE